jgi:hypothetical protein
MQADAEPPSETPPPPNNIFENTLLLSSPSDMIKMYNANQVLKAQFTERSVIHTPEKDYILCLGHKAERLQARITVLQERNRQTEQVLSARKVFKSGRRLSIEGKHLLTAAEVYEDVAEADSRIEERKNK